MNRHRNDARSVRQSWAALLLLAVLGLVIWSLQNPTDQPGAIDSAPPRSHASGRSETVRPGIDSSRPASELLRDVGGAVKESAAGLLYGPGGPEGHRLEHVLRHDDDLPDRPGIHGVFDGGPAELLAVIDEAYSLTRQGGNRITVTREGVRVIYDVNMMRRIGFVGGRVGRQRGRPAATHVRLVLEGRFVITAFPFQP